ncbi:MAG: ParB/RepB/Spo0J family partition protein [Ignavibacteria bacterium]|nr:ParB/RepB/Spo0J family partition protein [Ignavibacteria bacterium]
MSKVNKTGLGLGKGLSALIPGGNIQQSNSSDKTLTTDDGASIGVTAFIDISKVRPNPLQPRQTFDTQALQDLANSIKEHGVIQPITVRRMGNGYELISGERRLRASMEAGLTKIPAYILDIDTDAEMLEIAIIENVQRENLNPIEVAQGYHRLIEECRLTQEDVADKVGKDRSTVTNFLRLLRLPVSIQDAVRQKNISPGHARSMLSLPDEPSQLAVLDEIIKNELSVRKTESLIKDVENGRMTVSNGAIIQSKSIPSTQQKSPLYVNSEVAAMLGEIEIRLRHVFATQVRVRTKTNSTGSIELDYYSLEELERILDLFAIIEKNSM